MKLMSAAVMIALLTAAPTCLAANARNPYGNIDPRNDAGNDTGDLQVEALNQAQIDGGPVPAIRHAPPRLRYAPAPESYSGQEATPGGYAPPDGYYPARSYPPPPYQPAGAYAPPGYAPYQPAPAYPPTGYAPPYYGPGPSASPGYYAPRGYYAPPGYGPPAY